MTLEEKIELLKQTIEQELNPSTPVFVKKEIINTKITALRNGAIDISEDGEITLVEETE